MQKLYKRGPIWWCWVKENGQAVRKSTGCRDQKAASIRAAELEREGAAPRRLSQDTTVKDCLENLISDRIAAGKAPGTLGMYRNSSGHILRILGEETPLSQVTARTVDAFVNKRLEEKQGKESGRHSIHKDLVCLRLALKIARRRGEFDLDISQVMPVSFAVNYTPKERFLTHEEAKALLAEMPSERRAHLTFILATGARWGEMKRAELADIDLTGEAFLLRGTKTEGSRRTLPMVAHIKALLEEVVSDPYINKTGPMFAKWTNARRAILKACKRAKIEPVSANDLRRTPASWLRQAGVEPSIIGKFLGHVDPRMATKVYARMGDQLGTVMRESLGGRLGATLTKFGGQLAKTQPKRAKVNQGGKDGASCIN